MEPVGMSHAPMINAQGSIPKIGTNLCIRPPPIGTPPERVCALIRYDTFTYNSAMYD